MIMNKKAKMLLFFLMGLIIGGLLFSRIWKEDTYIPSFRLVGDVEFPLVVRNINNYERVHIQYNGKKIACVPLEALLEESNPLTENASLLIVGMDGLTAEVDISTLEKSYVFFSSQNGWNVIQLQHPISSHIKHIKEMVVVSLDEYNDFGINIFSHNKNIQNITAGQLYKMDYIQRKEFEGTSHIKVKGNNNYVTIYTTQNLVPLRYFVDAGKYDNSVIFSQKGSQTILQQDGYLKIDGNKISYISEDGIEIFDIAGIYFGDIISSNTDVYYDVEHYLGNDEKIMVILMDGFSYEQYTYAKSNHYLSFLSNYEASKVFSAVKPVTNTGFATMITGKTPDIHGIHDRSKRDYEGTSIFGLADDYGLNACLIEGDIKIINTEIEPVLNIDRNKNGDIDDEVFEYAKTNMKDVDLCFVHFHGIDDRGHTYGPLAEETLQYISIIDEYIKVLASRWDGHVIVTSDHGMHETNSSGDHGVCCYEDMIIPYITFQ